MRYRYVSIHNVLGVAMAADESEFVLFDRSADGLKLMLVRDPAPYQLLVDRALAISYLMLTSGLQGGDLEEKINGQVREMAGERRERHGSGLFLVVERVGEVDDIVPKHQRDCGDFVVGLDGSPGAGVVATSGELVRHLLSAFALISPGIHSLTKAGEGVTYFLPDGRSLYFFTIQPGEINALVSRPLDLTEVPNLVRYYEALSSSGNLATVLRLTLQALTTRADRLRSFLAGWTALEVLVNKVFPEHEKEFLTSVGGNAQSEAHTRFRQRIAKVMHDKYRPGDKFALIASTLAPDEADADVATFMSVKGYRDRFAHGEDIPESALPVAETHGLLLKYVRLHLRRGTAHS